MVAQITMRTYGVKQGFRFAEGIWLFRKSGQIHFFGKYLFSHHACAPCSEQPSNIKSMVYICIFFQEDLETITPEKQREYTQLKSEKVAKRVF